MAIYGTLEGALAYAQVRGNTAWAAMATDDLRTAALTRGTQYIDRTYGTRFVGVPAGGRSQELAWPRTGAVDYNGFEVTGIPNEVILASYEAAFLEAVTSGYLTPTVIPGQIKTEVAVEGAVRVKYAAGQGAGASSQVPVVSSIDGLLAPLLRSLLEPYAVTV